jgi:uncharacterized protein
MTHQLEALGLADPDDIEWWTRLTAGNLHCAHCNQCSRVWLRAAASCPYCASANISLLPVSGTGAVYTWTTVHRAFDPVFAERVPYVVVTVDLDEGARIHGLLSGGDPANGLRVQGRVLPIGDYHSLVFEVMEEED